MSGHVGCPDDKPCAAYRILFLRHEETKRDRDNLLGIVRDYENRARIADQQAAYAEGQKVLIAAACEILHKWLETEIDPEDDDYAQWMEEFTLHVQAWLECAEKPAETLQMVRVSEPCPIPQNCGQSVCDCEPPPARREMEQDIEAAMMDHFGMGFDAGLDCAMGLLESGILARDVTPTEIANELRLLKRKRPAVNCSEPKA